MFQSGGISDNGKLLMYRNDGSAINRYELVSFANTGDLPEGSQIYITQMLEQIIELRRHP